jgi:F-type H+-transporting ATPase subunit delta
MAETKRPIRDIDDFDPAVQRLAQTYAKAFLGAAEKTGRTDELLGEYESLLVEVVIPFQSIQRFIAPGTVTHEERTRVLDKAMGPHVSKDLMQFLKVVSRHERMDLLESIGAAARRKFNESRGIVRVEVETASALADGLADHVANRMRTILGSEPEVVVRHRPELIGGLVVRVGDTVFDGSVSYQLEQARAAMLDRSTHEIQSGRDRFSTASGN